MSNVIVFSPDKYPVYIESVNTPDYEGINAIINPDMSGVEGVPFKYVKRDGNNVVEMSQVEKDVVDAAELEARKVSIGNFNMDLKTFVKGILMAGNTRWSKGQEVTEGEVITWFKNQVE